MLGVVFVFVVIILGIFAALKGSPTLKVRTKTSLETLVTSLGPCSYPIYGFPIIIFDSHFSKTDISIIKPKYFPLKVHHPVEPPKNPFLLHHLGLPLNQPTVLLVSVGKSPKMNVHQMCLKIPMKLCKLR